ncbi:unnamed protein product [Lepeophtheirus salmonis]|uniref:(salmon louse) hypothetical protein n=1 Tax=Lepeophtheirus salmonis TaxID=72036 RepID=A0A7R8CZW2_LEPSM|nr:unnamed protein product [Lepeophtheirus salmonis]CAF2979165.1 unnamed protein product [Lepeophtheirus salmonis]
MLYLHHTKLLLWKNFKKRSREKTRTILEIFLPLALFILLVFVVRNNGMENIPSCHFEEKSMPSMGPELFIKNSSKMSAYNVTFVNRLLSDLEDSLYKSFNEKERAAAFSKIINDISSIRELSNKAKKRFAQGLSMQGKQMNSIW